MIKEEQVLKDAIEYLNEYFEDYGIVAFPKNQQKLASFPCIVLTVNSHEHRSSIYGEILANIQIHATVYADNIYAPTGSVDGIHTIFDMLNEAMADVQYQRSNQTEPYRNAQYNVWNKDGYFTKKSNTF